MSKIRVWAGGGECEMITGGKRGGVLLAISAAAAVVVGSSSASAGVFGIREQSAVGLGNAFAGAASGAAGVSSMFWNPATITMHPGHTGEYNATYIDPGAVIRVDPPTPTLGLGQSGDIGIGGVIPATYTAYQLTESIWIGLAGTAPYGLITKPNVVWAGETYSRSSRVFSINFAPVIGYRVNEFLSIAAGPTIQYFKTRLTSAAAPSPVAPSVILEGDDYGVGATVGVTVTPFAGTTIGVGYRSSIHHELDGTLRIPTALGAFVTPAKVNLNLPEQINFGLSQAITADFRLDFGFEFTNWSRLKLPAVTSNATGAPLAAVPLGYKDGYYYSVGGEYQFNPLWTVRAGAAYEVSPIDVSNRGTRVPDTDRVHANIGVGYKYSEKLDAPGRAAVRQSARRPRISSQRRRSNVRSKSIASSSFQFEASMRHAISTSALVRSAPRRPRRCASASGAASASAMRAWFLAAS